MKRQLVPTEQLSINLSTIELSVDHIIAFCFCLDPISLSYFLLTNRFFSTHCKSNALWWNILLKQFPVIALTTTPPQEDDGYYQIYRETVNSSYERLTRPERECFTATIHFDLDVIKAFKIQFPLSALEKKDKEHIQLYSYINDLNRPEFNEYIFSQNAQLQQIQTVQQEDINQEQLDEKHNNQEKIKEEQLISHGIRLNIHDDFLTILLRKYDFVNLILNGDPVLYLAVENDALQSTELLLTLGLDVNQVFAGRSHVLYLAAKLGNLDMVNKLLDKGANVNQTWAGSCTPLYIAAEQGHVHVVERLIHAGAQINTNPAPLISALRQKRNGVVQCLLKNLADVTILDGNESLLSLCARNKNIYATQLLLDYYKKNSIRHPHCLIDANPNGATAMEMACKKGCLEIVKMLAAHGANINQMNEKYKTPLFFAIKHRKVIDFLLEKGANPNHRHPNHGFTLLHWLCKKNCDFQIAAPAISSLILAGANPIALSSDNKKPSDIAEGQPIKNLMELLETIMTCELSEMVSIAPSYMANTEALIQEINKFIDNGKEMDCINLSQAKTCLQLLSDSATPFGCTVILYALLDREKYNTPTTTLFARTNEFHQWIINTLGFTKKCDAINALHSMICNSMPNSISTSYNVLLYDKLCDTVIKPIGEIVSTSHPALETMKTATICLNLFESWVKKALEKKNREERAVSFDVGYKMNAQTETRPSLT